MQRQQQQQQQQQQQPQQQQQQQQQQHNYQQQPLPQQHDNTPQHQAHQHHQLRQLLSGRLLHELSSRLLHGGGREAYEAPLQAAATTLRHLAAAGVLRAAPALAEALVDGSVFRLAAAAEAEPAVESGGAAGGLGSAAAAAWQGLLGSWSSRPSSSVGGSQHGAVSGGGGPEGDVQGPEADGGAAGGDALGGVLCDMAAALAAGGTEPWVAACLSRVSRHAWSCRTWH